MRDDVTRIGDRVEKPFVRALSEFSGASQV